MCKQKQWLLLHPLTEREAKIEIEEYVPRHIELTAKQRMISLYEIEKPIRFVEKL